MSQDSRFCIGLEAFATEAGGLEPRPIRARHRCPRANSASWGPQPRLCCSHSSTPTLLCEGLAANSFIEFGRRRGWVVGLRHGIAIQFHIHTAPTMRSHLAYARVGREG